MSTPEPASRARLAFAAGAAAVLVAAVVVIVLGGSDGDGSEPPPPPTACIEAWNSDKQAVAFGNHNSVSHAYLEVQVTRLTPRGTEPEAPDEGVCAVIFARTSLDPEPGAAAQVQRPNGSWIPLSVQPGVEQQALAKLQSEAVGLANANLETDGTITAP
jgi:hypothetical protein